MVQIVKQHKVTGEIVKADGSKWTDCTIGKINDATFAKIKAATEKATDWLIIGQEGTTDAYVMTAKDIELKAYYDNKARVEKAMSY
jgi:hypothetical protein